MPDSKTQHRISKELESLIVPYLRVCLLIHEGTVANRFLKDPGISECISEFFFKPCKMVGWLGA